MTHYEKKWSTYAQIHRQLNGTDNDFLLRSCVRMDKELDETKQKLANARRTITRLKKKNTHTP